MTTSVQREEATGISAPRRRNLMLAILTEPGLWLALYLVGLAFVGFWPVPVDRDADALLDSLTAALPWLTYDRIEFSANVLLFVPFGFLLAATLRLRVILAFIIAVAVSILLETGQAIFLIERTPAFRDVLANAAGALAGIALATLALRRPARARR